MKMQAPRLWRYNQERRRYLGKVGRIVGWSVVRVGPEGLEKRTPYVVGIVEVMGERVVAQITGVEPEKMVEGMRVIGRLRRLFEVPEDELIVYGVKMVALEAK